MATLELQLNLMARSEHYEAKGEEKADVIDYNSTTTNEEQLLGERLSGDTTWQKKYKKLIDAVMILIIFVYYSD